MDVVVREWRLGILVSEEVPKPPERPEPTPSGCEQVCGRELRIIVLEFVYPGCSVTVIHTVSSPIFLFFIFIEHIGIITPCGYRGLF